MMVGGSLLARRFGEVFSALTAHQTPPPSEFVSSLTLLEEEETYRRSGQRERDRSYWHAQLENRPEAVTLSGQAPRWPGHVLRHDAIIPSTTIEGLERLGAAHGASLPAVIAAAAALYLSRVTGATDVVLGMPMATRTNPKMRRVVGLATNT